MEQPKTEIVVYQPNETIKLEVKFDGETVWLSQEQMCQPFGRTQPVIARHIANIFKEGELPREGFMQNLHKTSAEGGRPVTYFNLHVVISVGYRVKSQMGTRFRIWATSIIHERMMPRAALPFSPEQLGMRVEALESRVGALEVKVEDQMPPREFVFFEGQIFDAYSFFCDRIREARRQIVVADNYVDDRVLTMLDKRGKNVKAVIFTGHCSKRLLLDVERHDAQYPHIQLLPYPGNHDRYLIIDKVIYHVGCSMKDAGGKGFAVIRMASAPQNVLKLKEEYLLK